MRWHPLIIRWCLSVYFSSPAAYKQIASKRLGFLKLPHVNTLKQYCKFSTGGPGFNPDILKRSEEEVSLPSLKEFQKNVTFIFDKMQIKSNLLYKKSTGELIGFTAMGDISEEFRKKFFSKYVKHDVHDTQVDSSDPAKKYQRYCNSCDCVYGLGAIHKSVIHLLILRQLVLRQFSCTHVPWKPHKFWNH